MSGWWDQVEQPTKDLAKRLAIRQGFDDQAMCLPYVKKSWVTYYREITLVTMASLEPVWAQYVEAAREVLAVRDELLVDAVVAPVTPVSEDAPVTFRDDPDASWRRERGLDGEDQA